MFQYYETNSSHWVTLLYFSCSHDEIRIDSTVPGTSYNHLHAFGLSLPPGTAFRSSSTAAIATSSSIAKDYDSRPMTAVAGAGYVSDTNHDINNSSNHHNSLDNVMFDPLQQASKSKSSYKPTNSTVEHKIKQFQNEIHQLMEESAKHLYSRFDHKLKSTTIVVDRETQKQKGLEQAKKAAKRERVFIKFCETQRNQTHSSSSPSYISSSYTELTFAVWFHLANAYVMNEMKDEAMNTYSFLLKKHQITNSILTNYNNEIHNNNIVRIRVNMGNIYYQQKQYTQAIQMYRMALDRISPSKKNRGYPICRNIGNAFFQLGRFRDAIRSFETIMNSSPDYSAGFNLILCYYSLEDVEKMKRGFLKLLAIPIVTKTYLNTKQHFTAEEENNNNEDDVEDGEEEPNSNLSTLMLNDENKAMSEDNLTQEIRNRRKDAEYFILRSARLIAPVLNKESWVDGYRWICDQLASKNAHIACHMEMEKALQHLHYKEMDTAIQMFKSFEKKEPWAKAMAANNLAFLYFLEGEYENSSKYADLAVKKTRYNAKALVNKGNCYFIAKEYDQAKDMYLEAVAVEPNCIEALYNLGLTELESGLFDDALNAFEKANAILPNIPTILYQMANIYEKQNQWKNATKYFHLLLSCVPSDPHVLSRIGNLFCQTEDESQGSHYQLESYRHYPVDLDVISWLGVWFVKHEMYEKSIHFFQRAAQIQPNEVKWELMVNSCYRRMGNYSKALKLYKRVHKKYPENIECECINDMVQY